MPPTTEKVTRLKPKTPMHVHECECGCQLFYLVSDGRVECRMCGHIPRLVRHLELDSLENPR
jgi:uncharacterized Zn finger protein (UPF0148 family)